MATTTTPDRRIGGADDLSAFYERYGRSDILASLVGMFAGLGALVFLTALIAVVLAGVGYQLDIGTEDVTLSAASVIGLIVAAVVVFVSFVVGGFAAGRMSRYKGGVNGLGAGLWLILLVAVFAALGGWLGAELAAFNRSDLPNWFPQMDANELTVMAVVGAAVLVAATLAGGFVGGRIGAAHHTRIDAALVNAARKES